MRIEDELALINKSTNFHARYCSITDFNPIKLMERLNEGLSGLGVSFKKEDCSVKFHRQDWVPIEPTVLSPRNKSNIVGYKFGSWGRPEEGGLKILLLDYACSRDLDDLKVIGGPDELTTGIMGHFVYKGTREGYAIVIQAKGTVERVYSPSFRNVPMKVSKNLVPAREQLAESLNSP